VFWIKKFIGYHFLKPPSVSSLALTFSWKSCCIAVILYGYSSGSFVILWAQDLTSHFQQQTSAKIFCVLYHFRANILRFQCDSNMTFLYVFLSTTQLVIHHFSVTLCIHLHSIVGAEFFV
jgi:hypothetical protein